MKKSEYFVVFLVIVLAVIMTGCGNGNENETETGNGTDVTDTVSATVTVSEHISEIAVSSGELTEAPEPVNEGVTVYSERRDDNGCSLYLKYPQYTSGSHPAFNEAVKDIVDREYRKTVQSAESGSVYEITVCDVLCERENIVSSFIAGVYSNDHGGEERFAYTVNVSLDGTVYTEDSVFCDLDGFKNIFAEGGFTRSYGLDVASRMDAEEIMFPWRDDYGIYPDFYITEDGKFGIVAEIAASAGGYAAFEIPMSKLGETVAAEELLK